MRRYLAIVPLLALLGVGCSSTNNDGSRERVDADARAVASAAPDATSTPSSGAATTGTRTGAPRGAGGIAAPGAEAGAPGTSRALPRGTGTIKIGFHYSENLDTAYRTLGASGSFVDVTAAIAKLVNHVNANGGVGGKKVVPVYHGTDPLIGTFPAQAEAACTHFAQDEKVFAVISGAVLPDINLPACHAKYKTPLVWDYQYLLDRKTLDGFGRYLYMPQAIAVERNGFFIDELWSMRFLTAGSKVAVVRYDDPVHKRFLDAVVKPGLAKRGLTAIDKPLKRPHSAGEAGDVATQASNVIIDLRAKGVDRIVFVPSGGAIPLIFGNVAQGQRYYPKVAITSFDIPTFVSENMSDQQLEGAVAVGWMLTNDTEISQLPTHAPLEACFKAAGVRSGSVTRFCEGLFFLKHALDKTPLFDVGGLSRAAYDLGQWTRAPGTFGSKIGPRRHDGANAYRRMRFTADCSCFRYEGSNKPVP